ncbi:MAG: hypothetical protein L0Y44_07200 [Phycisphaerales bacterium]|nr:hypothetical protein [Phycisphaerales bacterium]MCI0630426.1 hypothetical protein [Phycisphaerales bacterium]MCI0676541.1 hypothetical protein [Phycisphaerales bacterium]
MRSFVLEPSQPPSHPEEVGRYCPACGYDQIGMTGAALEIRCPECGSRWKPDELLTQPPPGLLMQIAIAFAALTRALFLAGVCVIILFIVFGMLIAILESVVPDRSSYAPTLRARTQLQQIHKACLVYAAESNDKYPVHAAALLTFDYFNTDLIVDPSLPRAITNTRVGTYDLRNFDGSTQAHANLQAAIAQVDHNAPYYRLGDFWLVRLPYATHDRQIIAAWGQRDPSGMRNVVFDDDHADFLSSTDWQAAWKADAAARVRLKLPTLTPPP